MKNKDSSIFDTAADGYDATFTDTVTGKLQREKVHIYIKVWLEKNTSVNDVLEVNCGTGEDALFLGTLGLEVLATDGSPKMVEVARNKTAPVSKQVKVAVLDLTNPDENLLRQEGPFDLIFSNFGGLNCLSPPELLHLSGVLAKCMSPSGQLVLVVMPRWCVWETVYFLLKGRFKDAFRRRSKGPVAAPLGGGTFVDTWYYSPAEMEAAFKQHFHKTKQIPIGCFLPPSYLDAFFAKRPRLMRFLEKMERWAGRQQWLAGVSDHCLVHFEMKGNE